MTINQVYTKELKEQLDRSATWPLMSQIFLGAVGKMINHKFDRRTSLKNLGIPFKSLPGSPESEQKYYSATRGSKTLKFSGDAPIPDFPFVKADAGVGFKFEKKNPNRRHTIS